MKYGAYLVPTAAIEKAWPDAKPFIERALAFGTGRREPDDVKQQLKDGDAALWFVYVVDSDEIHAAAVTEIIDYPRKRVLDLALMAGVGLAEWLALLGKLEDWARGLGCHQIQIHGRAGWGRVTSYPEAARVYVKELCDG